MPIEFTCPHCGLQTNVADEFAGQKGPCAGCGETVTIPAGRSAMPPRQAASASSTVPILVIVLVVAVGGFLVCGGILVALLLPAVQAAREAARRSQCSANLKWIGEAIYNYHDHYGSLPPAFIADENGRPMHSWRVLLLPYLEQKSLYDQYDFNEPWDGPNNSRLAASMPAIYTCPSDDSSPGQGITSYVVVAGQGTAFDGSKAAAFRDIGDGVANTVLVVESSGTQINWLEPRDLDLNQMNFVINGGPTEISSNHVGRANALFADGSVHSLSDTLPPQTVQGLLTIQGGENVSPF
ncbi:MAG: DUF1559 domain-containing protein [Pirellulales bacterium]